MAIKIEKFKKKKKFDTQNRVSTSVLNLDSWLRMLNLCLRALFGKKY